MKLINREGIPSLDSYIELIKEEISVNKIKKNSILFKKMCSKFFKKISKNEDKLEGENFIQGKSIEDYYTDLYQEFVRSGGVSEDEERYRKVVTVQNSKYKDQFEILGLEETFAVLSKHIEVYYEAYRLPKSVITNSEWDTLFDSIFELFKSKEITNLYYQSMGIYLRSTLARVLVFEGASLSLKDFIDNIDALVTSISYYSPVSLTDEEINNLKVKIQSGIIVHPVVASRKQKKVVQFSDYQKKKESR